MARFKFPLQALLHMRERAERDEQLAFAALEHDRVSLQQELAHVQGNIAQAQHDARALLDPNAGTIDLQAARWQAHAALHQQALAGQLRVSLSGAQVRSDQQRERLLRASIARRALERLRERRMAEWSLEQKRREQFEQDDVATQRAARARKEG
ncbi:MAG: flagellar FliJ family protein [Phycisphaerales bacterium]|nr:flagellar FliJ family protein [Phycisphaerales bacterium]